MIFYLFIYFIYFWLLLVFVAAHGLSLVAASGGYSLLRSMGSRRAGSVVVARGLSSCGSRVLECRLSSCGTWAQVLHGMWDLPGPGLKPVFPAVTGGFLTTVPPGKPLGVVFLREG